MTYLQHCMEWFVTLAYPTEDIVVTYT